MTLENWTSFDYNAWPYYSCKKRQELPRAQKNERLSLMFHSVALSKGRLLRHKRKWLLSQVRHSSASDSGTSGNLLPPNFSNAFTISGGNGGKVFVVKFSDKSNETG